MRTRSSFWRWLWGLALVVGSWAVATPPVLAAAPGMHVLSPDEIVKVATEFGKENKLSTQPIYVTVPFTLADVDKLPDWQRAFDVARDHHIVPIVRLATRFSPEQQAWQVPTRKNIIDLVTALGQLQWPQSDRLVIIGNEPNHAREWGGTVDPESFAEISAFAADWLATEPDHYFILPAAMDLAAPNGKETKEALAFWRAAVAARPDQLDKFSAWNSHSYPNPGFQSAPQRTAQNSLRGYQHELTFLQHYTDRPWEVYITETGWSSANLSTAKLRDYYAYAWRYVWNDPQIKAVTPFVLTGDPGPFADFSFFAANGRPTAQWQAYLSALLSQPLAETITTPMLQ
jgi:hypothetical protein